jgi:hypothetical protein
MIEAPSAVTPEATTGCRIIETEIPCAPAWKQPIPTGGHGKRMESISTSFNESWYYT